MDQETLAAFKRLLSAYPCVRIVTYEEAESLQMSMDAAADLRSMPWGWSCTHGLRQMQLADAENVPNSLNPAAALVWLHDRLTEPAMVVMLDLADHLDDARTLRAALELIELFRGGATGTVLGDSRLVLIDHKEKVDTALGEAAVRFEIFPPDDEEIADIVKGTLKRMNRAAQVQASMKESDFNLYVQTLRGLSRRQVRALITECVAKDRTFTAADYPKIVEAKPQAVRGQRRAGIRRGPGESGRYRRAQEAEGVAGGAWRCRSRPDAGDCGLEPPRGVLLLGVQGAGKSLAARAIATAWKPPAHAAGPGRPVRPLHRREREPPARGPAPGRGDEPGGLVDR